MKLALASGAALALGLAAAANAQPQDQRYDNRQPPPAPPARTAPARPAPARPAPAPSTAYRGGATYGGYRGQATTQTYNRGAYQGAYRGQAGVTTQTQTQTYNRGAYNPAYRGQAGVTAQTYNRAPAQGYYQRGGQTYGQRGYEGGRGGYERADRAGWVGHSFQARERFRGEEREYPEGWSYRRWGYGMYLPFGWFAPSFYLSWNNYGLPEPPPGTEWVQQGSDAVLVDLSTGMVLSVEYGVFY